MSTVIDATALVTPRHAIRPSALRLAVLASRQALHQAGEVADDVDLIINTGLYRDRNLGEPALAPIIQQDIGANPEDPYRGGIGTFSFDIANGVCGPLSALQVAHGFLSSGTAETVLVLASDADPGYGLAPDFPIRPAGGALVCHARDGDRGVGPFRWANSHDKGETFRATIEFEDGINLLTIAEDPSFAEQSGRLAAAATRRLMTDQSLEGPDIDLVVAAPDRPEFRKVLGSELGIPDGKIVSAGPDLQTVSFVAALDLARSQGRLVPGSTIVFVCAAAGLTAGAALYRP